MNKKNLQLRALFEMSLINETLVALPNEYLRGAGKTELLIEYSAKYNMPILVKFKTQEELFKERGIEVYSYGKSLHGKRFSNGVLIDEGFDKEEIDMLRNYGINIKGGFVNI